MAREPGYCRHKATNQAYVRLNGRVIYLGEYGSEKSKERYNRLKAEWLVNRRSKMFLPRAQKNFGPTVADVCLAFLDHAEKYYSQSNEAKQFELTVKPLSELYATLPASNFGPMQFRACRDWWLQDVNRTRQYINKLMRRVRSIFKWAAGQGMIPPAIYEALRCVEPIKRGRTNAKEAEPITPVDSRVVDATLKLLTPVVADMVRFQQLVGCRPGEVCSIMPSMVDRSGDVWKIRLDKHKTAHHGKHRTIYVGPKAQAVLSKYLLRAANTPCFSPIESEQQRLEARHASRKTSLNCGNVPGSNRKRVPRTSPTDRFSASTYANSIRYACKRGNIPEWSPNRLRHSAATEIRKKFGLEGAQVILGHASADITQVYAERDAALAVSIAREVG